ncbi:nitrile hydratase accessory protein [Pseudooceanicola sp.]|uniref:nitrile hydratase accessory protein n=1 Tax=Pseudooceanicola sp. TaxID=1914328 RepID=UPI00262D903B|nr:nitrile hydratase accessory protein [Pseudooceanicola sp.]MDF1857163.1 nitrile hydratase accessory protein [Pseudooceanicola sp.]
MSAPDTPIPGITGAGAEPHFFAPWQAKAFALTIALHEAGTFTWPEWAAAFSERLHSDIAPPTATSSADHAEQYFTAWLATLEALLARLALTDPAQVAEAAQIWQRAAHATPHGQPILFERGLADRKDS